MQMGIRDRVALVAGASKGLGRAVARGLAAEGCNLALCARGQEGLDAVADEIATEFGVEVWARAVDLADSRAAAGFAAETIEKLGAVDIRVSETDPLPRVTPEVCPLPFNNLVVDERGDVRVCCNTWKILGNTYRDAMEDIVAGKVAKRFRRKVEAGDYNWCDPYCGNNPKPSKQALLNKYSYLARRDPKGTYGKLKAKLKRRKQLAS